MQIDVEVRVTKLEIKGSQCIYCGHYFIGRFNLYWARRHVKEMHGKRPVNGARGNVRPVCLLVDQDGISLDEGIIEVVSTRPDNH